MGLFDKKTPKEKEIEEEALKELNSYKANNYAKYKLFLQRFGVLNMGGSEKKVFNNTYSKVKKEIKKEGLPANKVKLRFIGLLSEIYGEELKYDSNKKFYERPMTIKDEKEKKLEKKFKIKFQNRTWFKCTIEEKKLTTFSNANRREVDYAYVFVEDNYLEIVKESVFLKSNMGNRKIYYENIASIDYDARGKLHLSNSLIINLKASETVQLKNIQEKDVNIINSRYDSFLRHKNNENTVDINNIPKKKEIENKNDNDNPMKKIKEAKELLDMGAITEEEFDKIKAKYLKDF
ncbi:SHOCT domain-containing protein [Methanobrevibacter millerae]|nr:SHOCT domain-containing protein [Methanobrevibacter millerae]